jgi:hypothetical protein
MLTLSLGSPQQYDRAANGGALNRDTWSSEHDKGDVFLSNGCIVRSRICSATQLRFCPYSWIDRHQNSSRLDDDMGKYPGVQF